MSKSTKIKTLGPVFDELSNHVAMLNLLWQTYTKLFATNEQRFNLFKDQAPGIGRILHDLLVDSVILGICRVTDPATTRNGHENLTLERLISTLPPAPDAELDGWLKATQATIKKAIPALKKHRNQRLAHNALSLVLNAKAKLPQVFRKEISAILANISALMARLSETYRNAGINYSVIMPGDADALIRALQRSDLLSDLQDDLHVRRLAGEKILAKLANRMMPEI